MEREQQVEKNISLEKKYKADFLSFMKEKRRRSLFNIYILGCVVNPLFFLLDYVLLGERAWDLFPVRISASVVSLVFLLIYKKWQKWMWIVDSIGSLPLMLVALHIALVMRHSGGSSSPYLFGLMMMVVISGLYVYCGKYEGFFLTFGIASLYNIPAFWTGDDFNLRLYLINSTILYGLSFMTLYAFNTRFSLEEEGFFAKRQIELQNEHLKTIDQAKTRFFANVSHELRTPLALIQGPLVQFYQDEQEEAKKGQLAMCIRNVHRLLNEVNDLLDFAKLESGRMMLSVAPVQLGEIVTNLVDLMSPASGVRPIVTRKDELPPIYIDKGKLEKVISNLIINAIKFSRESGQDIEVEVRADGESHALIIIRDFGQGIDPVQLPHIFDRFYQGDEKMVRGTGLGLTMVKEYVELHHGTVTVESEKGKGTTFTVALPLSKEWFQGLDYVKESMAVLLPTVPGANLDQEALRVAAQADVNSHALPGPLKVEGGGKPGDYPEGTLLSGDAKKILIVDDELDMGSYIKTILQGRYRTMIAYNGREGLSKVASFKPDLILSDVMMPEMNGYEFTKALRDNPETSDIPVILLTANAAHESLLESFKHGANDYLSKPFHVDELLLRVDNQLRLSSQKEQLKEAYDKLKEAESELVHAQKLSAVGTLAAGVSHHLNNALFSMVGEIENLNFLSQDIQQGKVTPRAAFEELHKSHEVLSHAHERAQRIVESLMNFSSTNRPKEREIDVNSELEDTLFFFDTPTNIGVRFHRRFGPVGKISCFASDVTHSFMSVLQNAVSAVKEKGTGNVWLETQDTGRDIIVSIKNDGPPIPEDIRDQIFDPFFSTKDVDKGNGLGLAIAARAMERQGGSVVLVASTDKLTEFQIRIQKKISEPLARIA